MSRKYQPPTHVPTKAQQNNRRRDATQSPGTIQLPLLNIAGPIKWADALLELADSMITTERLADAAGGKVKRTISAMRFLIYHHQTREYVLTDSLVPLTSQPKTVQPTTHAASTGNTPAPAQDDSSPELDLQEEQAHQTELTLLFSLMRKQANERERLLHTLQATKTHPRDC